MAWSVRGRVGHRVRLVITAVVVAAVAGLVLAAAGSVGIRGDVWSAAGAAVAAHPLGVGIGRSGAVITAAMPGGDLIEHAHDFWLNWAVEAGYPGLVAVLALTAAAVVAVVRAMRNGSRSAPAIGAGLAGFATICLVDHPANSLRVALALWVVLGLLAAADVAAQRPGSTAHPTSARSRRTVSVRARAHIAVTTPARTR